MNFLVDAQLPPGLARWLSHEEYSAQHVDDSRTGRHISSANIKFLNASILDHFQLTHKLTLKIIAGYEERSPDLIAVTSTNAEHSNPKGALDE